MAADTISLGLLLPPPLPVVAELLGKAIPSRQLFDGVVEKRVLVIAWTIRFARALDSASEILLEMVEAKNLAINELRRLRFFGQRDKLKADRSKGA